MPPEDSSRRNWCRHAHGASTYAKISSDRVSSLHRHSWNLRIRVPIKPTVASKQLKSTAISFSTENDFLPPRHLFQTTYLKNWLRAGPLPYINIISLVCSRSGGRKDKSKSRTRNYRISLLRHGITAYAKRNALIDMAYTFDKLIACYCLQAASQRRSVSLLDLLFALQTLLQ